MEKQTLKNTIVSEAQFRLVLNWAFLYIEKADNMVVFHVSAFISATSLKPVVFYYSFESFRAFSCALYLSAIAFILRRNLICSRRSRFSLNWDFSSGGWA